jgi:hypothetical protein
VRWLAFVFLVLFCCNFAWAQDQERSLVDRLLRPNMDLQNRAQGKAFTANSKVAAHPGSACTFVLKPAAKQKTFDDTRSTVTKEYRSGADRSDLRGNSFVQTRNATVPAHLSGSSPARDVRAAYDARLAVSGRSFAGERAFRDQGKDQESLDRQSRSMTIDQVRELLNKNR